MKTIQINLYKFEELSKEAQAKAIYKLQDINVMLNWWSAIYEDAKNIGIKISEFDIDKHFCYGNFIDGAKATAEAIIENHGPATVTAIAANAYLSGGEEYDRAFLPNLLAAYLEMLKSDYQYLTSEKAIIEAIEANEYDFTEDGEIYRTE